MILTVSLYLNFYLITLFLIILISFITIELNIFLIKII